ncbi:MAG: polyprenyl synthetase family protein [Acidobacteriota bacterium]
MNIAEEIRANVKSDMSAISYLVADKLEKTETLFAEMLRSRIGIISTIGKHIANSGGKRIRPLVHLLSAGMCGHKGERDILFASIFESIHTATLIHDDIIDNAHTRRGRVTVNRKWGNSITVLIGDYLFTKSVFNALHDGNLKIIHRIAEITMKMIEGELMQEDSIGKIDLTEEEYIEIARRKTACLFSGCTSIAGIISDASDQEVKALEQFGMNFGIAFQLIDDLLDLTSDEKVLGKPAASDLKEGRLTLPLIYLLQIGILKHRKLITSILGGHDGEDSLKDVIKIVGENGVIKRARDRAFYFAEKAKIYLEAFPHSDYRDALINLTDLIINRDR